MQPEGKQFQATIGTKTITIETGRLAGQAGGAVTIQLGDTVVFASATMSSDVRTGIDFFPLTVDYEERMYAGGRIPGSFFRREGRPTEDAILTARLTDRPLRPLFPKDLRNDVQVIIYSFSTDGENPIDVLAVNAASTALMISDIPWEGPIGAVRIGYLEGEFVVNPTFPDMEYSELDLRMAATRDAILMVETGAQEIDEETMIRALQFGFEAIQPLIDVQEKMAREVGKPKREYPPFKVEEGFQARIEERVRGPLAEILGKSYEKSERNQEIDHLRDTIVTEFAGEDESLLQDVKTAFDTQYKKVVRQRIIQEGIRPDGRSLNEIRPDLVPGQRKPTCAWLGSLHPWRDTGHYPGNPRYPP
jgi:polyribonucleotide nucleotidyltransferase